MSLRSDPSYLKTEQYQDASHLQARIALHQRFSTNPYNWFLWVFDHFSLPAQAEILELGCGSAALWKTNLHRLPPGWQITLSDFSPGMLADARRNLENSSQSFRFELVDAVQIQFPDHHFDALVANHMLYHVPHRPQALAEIRRVLKPGGNFFAATNGSRHLLEIDELISLASPGLREQIDRAFSRTEFTLENGAAQISAHFAQVTRLDYPDGLFVTEAQPLVDYILSLISTHPLQVDPEFVSRLTGIITRRMQDYGSINVTKATGLFIAQ